MKLVSLQAPDAYFTPILEITDSVCATCVKWWNERVDRQRKKLAVAPKFSQITLPSWS